MKVSELKTEITNRYPDIDFTDKSDSENLFLEFSSGTQLEYNFIIWFKTESICASVGAKLLNSSDKAYFWYFPFDSYGSDSIEKKYFDSLEFLFEQLDILIKHKTRITQKKNLLSQTFVCEYFQNDKWTTFYKHSALKTRFEFPKTMGNKKIYE